MDNCFLYTSVLRFNPALDDPGFGADVVMIDLEDSVHISAKTEARRALATLDLRELVRKGRRFGIRMNSLQSIDGVRDLDIVHSGYESGRLPIEYLQVPKVDSHHELAFCRSLFKELSPRLKFFTLVETPTGIDDVERIASLSDIMLFGQADITATMYRPNAAYLDYARGRFCTACARYDIPAIDTKGFSNLTDLEVFEKDCRDALEEGFVGKAIIHPMHISTVKRIFSISPQETEQYRQIITQYYGNRTGFTIIEGNVIAPPFVAKAEKMLSLWDKSLKEL